SREILRAFSSASASAKSRGATLSASSAAFAVSSSTCAASASCGTPAERSISRRDALCDARTRTCWFIGVTPSSLFERALVAQLDDRRGSLLDRAPRDVDHRPALIGEHAARERDFAC